MDWTVMLGAAEWETLALSLKVALCCAIFSLPLAVAAGFTFSRMRFPGKAFIEALAHLPLVLPPVSIGYALLVLLGKRGLVGDFLSRRLGLELAFTWQAAAIASAVVSFPLFARSVRTALDMVDRRLEEAASTLGCGRLEVFLRVTLPLAWPGVLGGFLLAFTRSLGEFGATAIFAGNIQGETRTLPLAIYTAMQIPGGESEVFRLFVISSLASVFCFCAAELFCRKIKHNQAAGKVKT